MNFYNSPEPFSVLIQENQRQVLVKRRRSWLYLVQILGPLFVPATWERISLTLPQWEIDTFLNYLTCPPDKLTSVDALK